MTEITEADYFAVDREEDLRAVYCLTGTGHPEDYIEITEFDRRGFLDPETSGTCTLCGVTWKLPEPRRWRG